MAQGRGRGFPEETEERLQKYKRREHCGFTEAKEREHLEMREVAIVLTMCERWVRWRGKCVRITQDETH